MTSTNAKTAPGAPTPEADHRIANAELELRRSKANARVQDARLKVSNASLQLIHSRVRAGQLALKQNEREAHRRTRVNTLTKRLSDVGLHVLKCLKARDVH